MSALLRIAFRNLREHRAKTIIVGVLVALGVLLLIVGNSLLTTAAAGTERVFLDNFTGDVMVRARSSNPVAITGSTGFTMDDLSGPRLPHYREVYEYLHQRDDITVMNPQVPFIARLDYSEPGRNRFAMVPVFGVEPEAYLRMFPDTVSIVDGRFLQRGEQGIVLHRVIQEQVADELGIAISIGDTVRLQSISQSAGTRIRRVPVVGVYELYVEAPAMEGVSFMDANTVRDLAGMVIGTTAVVSIDDADTSLLDTFVGEDLFSQDMLIEDSGAAAALDLDAILPASAGQAEQAEQREYSRVDSGAWSYILLKLENRDRTDEVIAAINADMAERGWEVEAVGWDKASGGMAGFVLAFQVLFLIIVAIITIVSVIIIMNTLVISVVERTAEIGTMRALGARKSLVRRLFVLETMSIAVVFGTIGLLLGLLLLWVLGMVGVSAPNGFFEILFGGEVLRPVFSVASIFQALVMMLGIGFAASLYPVSVALKIQPLQAMQSE